MGREGDKESLHLHLSTLVYKDIIKYTHKYIMGHRLEQFAPVSNTLHNLVTNIEVNAVKTTTQG